MKITAETLPERQVKLQIEVDDERHAEAMEEAYKRLAPRVQIRGFRPGKAPRPLIEKQLGHHRLLDEAMDILVPKAYQEALDEQDLTPVASPSVELVSHEPLVFTATVPLRPEIDLGDLQALRVPREAVTTSDEQVEESIRDLRRRYGTIEPVDRPAQKGDIIRGNLRAEVDGAPFFEQDEFEYRLTDESLSSLPGLADAVVGLTKGDEIEKEVPVPADSDVARLAGKTVKYHIVVHDVKEEKLAEENEAFAKEVGEGFESVKALRNRIREDLQKAADEEALRAYETKVVDALLEQSKLDYPQVLVDHEIEHILEDESNLDPRDQRAQELYLARLGKSEQEVKESVKPEAELRLRRSLVLSQFTEAENINVEDADIDAEIESMAAAAGEQSAAIRRIFEPEAARDSLRRNLLTRKALARLVEIAGQEAPAPAAKPKGRRSAPRKANE